MSSTLGLRGLALAAALATGTAPLAHAADPMVGGAPESPGRTIV